jgi:gluconate 2-dehydrogenase gamma chain
VIDDDTGNALPLVEAPFSDLSRRQVLGVLAGLPVASLFDRTTLAARAWQHVSAHDSARQHASTPTTPRFFTAHEWHTVRMLVDYVIPRDARSGSATDAGVPEFMDFIMIDQPDLQIPIRGGLHWLDTHCHDRFGAPFIDCLPAQRIAVLDEIAWPKRATPATSQGVAFFSRLRDLVASGFWTSPMGVADLQYLGNTVVHEWHGCPDAALAKLGVSYS